MVKKNSQINAKESWLIVNEDGKVFDSFRLKDTAKHTLSKLQNIYFEKLKIIYNENQ